MASEKFFGDYDWKFLCMPPNPFKREARQQPPFYGPDDKIAPFVAIIMGLQHALAMVGGVITVPLILAGMFQLNFSVNQTQYLISAALIVSGITSIIQVVQIKIPKTSIVIGTGVLSVMGTSFTFLPIAQDAIAQMKTNDDFIIDAETFTYDNEKMYGAILGTFLVCSFVEIVLAFVNPKALRKVFPPIVTGVTVFLIGAALVGTGFKYWGGGAFCGDNFDNEILGICKGNGNVWLPFGSSAYVGLGFSVFCMLVLLEIFGSPFMRSINVVIALLFGYFVAAVSRNDESLINFDGFVPENFDQYVVSDKIDAAKPITFLWVFTFPLSVYAPLVIPSLLAFIITTVETIGDVTTTAEVSKLEVEGPEHFKRIRGGLLGDGISSFLSALMTSMPNTTFSQNNGVIALTRCASRQAGLACAGWLILFGILAKIAAFFTSIPDCVLGGMTTFLFANVAVSGIKIIASAGDSRRARFIVACSLGLGLGVTIAPQWAQNNLWPCSDCGEGLKSFRDGVILILSTGYSMGCAAAIILNLIIPNEAMEETILPTSTKGVEEEKGQEEPNYPEPVVAEPAVAEPAVTEPAVTEPAAAAPVAEKA